METNITTYSNEMFGDVRTITDEGGNPMLCHSDVCKALGISNPSQALKRLDERGLTTNEGTITNQYGASHKATLTYINEPNLYRLIFQSRKKSAIQFQDWVFNEVLPSIRKNGGFIVGQRSISKADFEAMVLQEAQIISGTTQRMLTFYKNMCAQLQAQVEELQSNI